MSTTPQAPPRPTAATAATAAPTITDLLSVIVDQTMRQQVQQAAIDQYTASRTAAATGVPSPRIELQLKYGREYGFNEVQSLEWIYLYPQKDGQFKPLLDYKGRAFLLKRHGYDWRPVEHTDVRAEFVFYKDGVELQDFHGKPLTITWTIERATKAGLVGRARSKPKGPTDKQEEDGTYDKYPWRMLFAKVIHDFGAVYAQEVSGAGMIDKFDAPTLDQVVEETERIKMPEAIKEEVASADIRG